MLDSSILYVGPGTNNVQPFSQASHNVCTKLAYIYLHMTPTCSLNCLHNEDQILVAIVECEGGGVTPGLRAQAMATFSAINSAVYDTNVVFRYAPFTRGPGELSIVCIFYNPSLPSRSSRAFIASFFFISNNYFCTGQAEHFSILHIENFCGKMLKFFAFYLFTTIFTPRKPAHCIPVPTV